MKKINIIISALAFSLFIVGNAFAEKVELQSPTPGITSIPQFLKALLDIMVKIGIPISTVFIIIAGFLFVFAQGDPTKLTQAKSAFKWSVIGMGVVLSAWLLATGIQNTMESIAK